MTGKRERTKTANREAILAAAREVFTKLGYGATTVRDIIRATDLASGTFYNYFKSKEEVFQAIQDENALRVRPRLRAERIRARSVEEFISGSSAPSSTISQPTGRLSPSSAATPIRCGCAWTRPRSSPASTNCAPTS